MRKARIISLISVMLLVLLLPLNVSANSAIKYFTGSDQYGVFITDEDCPVEVTEEKLEFNIINKENIDFRNPQFYDDYNNNVIASYTFHNPSEMNIEATLLFPFGSVPSYVPASAVGNTFFDTEKYDITVNGEEIEKQYRISLRNNDFDIQKSLEELLDIYYEGNDFSRYSVVREYTVTLDDAVFEKYSDLQLEAQINYNNESYFIFPRLVSCLSRENSQFAYSFFGSLKQIVFYVVGTDYPDSLKVIRENKDSENFDFTIDLTRETSLETFLVEDKPDYYAVSDMDYFNAKVFFLKREMNERIIEYYNESFYERVMFWYQYHLTFKPHESLINSVKALMYPAVDMRKEPSVYSYSYLISPAKTWKSFRNLTVTINTNMYLQSSKPEGFTGNREEGYILFSEKLPDGEIEFSLCSIEHPQNNNNYGWLYLLVFILPIVAAVMFILLMLLLIRKMFGKKRRYY